MTGTRAALQYRRLRAPREHGQALLDPALPFAPGLLNRNRQLAENRQYDVQGRPLAELAQAARGQLIQAAMRHSSAYRDPSGHAFPPDTPLILAGHQPQLFHPGVWFKNFVLSELGRRLSACAVNLLIDNDNAGEPSIRVPSGTVEQPRVESVLFDRPEGEVPFEERGIRDPALFASFAERVVSAIRSLVPHPLVEQIWPHARQAARGCGNLGCCMAQARHRLEADWGLSTLEVPLSRLCDAEPFYWFATHLMCHLPRFHALYNDALAEYRRVNRVRSHSHPVPNLAVEDAWLEAPFWVWTCDDVRRRKVFVRQRGEQIEVSDLGSVRIYLDVTAERPASRGVDRLMEERARGVKLRPRALITTMYARVILGDLFLHGIGGAKYDQLTDLLIEQFFEFPAPSFLTATATAQLPIPGPAVSGADLRDAQRQLRELHFHPEKFLENSGEARQLAEEKRQWIALQLPRGARRPRHQQIERLNERLRWHVSQLRQEVSLHREELTNLLRTSTLLTSREYSFCLFPEQTLRPLLLELLRKEP